MKPILVTLLVAVLPTLSVAEEPNPLAVNASTVLMTHCYRCHGDAGAVEGGLNYILDRDRLVTRKKIIPEKADESPIYKRVATGTMPPPEVKQRMTDEEKKTLRDWINAGAPPVTRGSPRRPIISAMVNDWILADLEKIDRRSRRFYRYFTFHHLFNAGLGDGELQTYRNALAKLVNSLSWHPKVQAPQSIDANQTVFRIDLRWYLWDATLWNRIITDYPYGILDDSATARTIMVSAATKLPLVRGDWFIATASRPPLYQDILQLPANLAELERQLRIDASVNITQERVMRLAFNGSGISKNNRILERHDSVHGYYWRTYDFEEVPQNLIERGLLAPDRRNAFAYPLGPGNLENNFLHAGGEAIFSLPNGLQGYYIMNAVNNRLDKAPTAIVSDPKRPDRAVELGVSCMGCHVPGILTKADQMHDHLEKNPKAIAKLDRDIALSLYPSKEKSIAQMEEDSKRFREALERTGTKFTRTEPIITMTLRYEADMDVVTAAAEVGLTPEEFQKRINESEPLSKAVSPLRIGGGTIARQVWVQSFGDLVRELRLGALFQSNQIGASLPDNTGELDPLEVSAGQSNHMAFVADGRKAIIASADRSVRDFDVEGRRDRKRWVGHTASVWAIALSPQGTEALSGGMDGSVRHWEVESGRQLAKLEGHLSLVSAVAFAPDGKQAISGGYDGALIVWDLAGGKELRRWEGTFKYIHAIAVSPDGKKILVAGDQLVRLIELETGKPLLTLEGHTAPVSSLAFSADGKKALSGGDDRTARLWDLATGKQLQLFSGHDNAVRAVTLNEKGTWALTGSADTTVRLWQTATGKELGKFTKHTEPVVSVRFLNNGTQTISGSRDNAIHPWNIEKFYPTSKVDPSSPPNAVAPIDLKPIAKIPIHGTIGRMALSPDRKSLYYVDRSNHRVGRIDLATHKIANWKVIDGIEDITTIRDGSALIAVVSNERKGAVVKLDPKTLDSILTIPLRFRPESVEDLNDMSKGGQPLPVVLIRGHPDDVNGTYTLFFPTDVNRPLEQHPNTTGAESSRLTVLRPLATASDPSVETSYELTANGWLNRTKLAPKEDKAKWKLPLTAYQLAFDGKSGHLFMAVIDPESIRANPRARGHGDIWIVNANELKP